MPHALKEFATVAITNGSFSSTVGLLCCADADHSPCEGGAAKAQALYSPGYLCSILGLSTYDLDKISPEEVMTAYTRSAKAAHPDKGGSAASMHILEIARRVILDARWREAYRRQGWVGVHAAWKKAGCSQASSFDAEAPFTQARPNFFGVVLHDGRVIVVPVTAFVLVGDDADRDLFESPHWLLLPPGSTFSQDATTYVGEFLQAPAALSSAYDTGPSFSYVTNSGALSIFHTVILMAPCG